MLQGGLLGLFIVLASLLPALSRMAVAAPPSITSISSREYEEIKKIALQISERCPQPDCLVVGLGRSPASIVAFLQARSPQAAVNLPMSEFRRNSVSGPLEEKLFKHFDRFVGSKIPPQTKRVLLIDYAQLGVSLYSAQEQLRNYLAAKRPGIDSEALAVVEPRWLGRFLQRQTEAGRTVSPLILRAGSILGAKMANPDREGISQYGRFNLDTDESAQLTEFAQYKELVQELRKAQLADSELAAAAPGCVEQVLRLIPK